MASGSFLSYKRLKPKKLGGFSRSYCCHGNMLYKKDDSNLFTIE